MTWKSQFNSILSRLELAYNPTKMFYFVLRKIKRALLQLIFISLSLSLSLSLFPSTYIRSSYPTRSPSNNFLSHSLPPADVTKRTLTILSRSVCGDQCDQIWWNFSTLAKLQESLEIYEGLFSRSQYFESLFCKKRYAIGHIFIIANCQILKT